MATLEKILQEIGQAITGTMGRKREGMILCMDIVQKHLSSENEIAKRSWDNGGWTAVEDGLPECEQEVYILTERGTETTAIYEDGKMLESKSKWHWNDIQGEWNDEEDCMIIPEGWWEYRHFNPDDVYNNVVDENVIAWSPLPDPYKPPVESVDSKRMREREEFFKEGDRI